MATLFCCIDIERSFWWQQPPRTHQAKGHHHKLLMWMNKWLIFVPGTYSILTRKVNPINTADSSTVLPFQSAWIVFDVQLSIWQPRSCSTDAVKNVLLIIHFIKFNSLFFSKKLTKNWKNGRNRTLLDYLKNQYNKNEILIFKKYQFHEKTNCQCSLKMPPQNYHLLIF